MPMTTLQTADWWKWTASASAGALLTGLIGFLALWSVGYYRWQTDDQVREMLKSESPYVHDKPLIESRLDKNERDIASAIGKLDVIISGQSDVKVAIALIQRSVQQIEQNQKKSGGDGN